MSELARIAVIGGTGALGLGIAARLAKAGHPVIIGSRNAAKAAEVAASIGAAAGGAIGGTSNADAAAQADVVFLAVPFASHAAILDIPPRAFSPAVSATWAGRSAPGCCRRASGGR